MQAKAYGMAESRRLVDTNGRKANVADGYWQEIWYDENDAHADLTGMRKACVQLIVKNKVFGADTNPAVHLKNGIIPGDSI